MTMSVERYDVIRQNEDRLRLRLDRCGCREISLFDRVDEKNRNRNETEALGEESKKESATRMSFLMPDPQPKNPVEGEQHNYEKSNSYGHLTYSLFVFARSIANAA